MIILFVEIKISKNWLIIQWLRVKALYGEPTIVYATIFFSWDFHSFKLGATSVVDLLLLAITLVFWTHQKDILGQDFF